MTRSRVARGRQARQQRRMMTTGLAVAAAVAVIAGAATLAMSLTSPSSEGPVTVAAADGPLPESSLQFSDGATGTATATGSAVASAELDVEVPDVVGKDLDTAEMIIEAAGLLTSTRVADSPAPGFAANTVIAQEPSAGTRTSPDQSVTLVYQSSQGASGGSEQIVVVLDAGHQAKADLRPEPIGPGSSATKERVRGGTTGIATGIPEYKQTLSVAMKVRDRLQKQGVRVIMVRTTNDANVSNRERALLGNKHGADLVLRVHFDGSSDSGVKGISTLFPGGNAWVKPISAKSQRAAGVVHAAVISATRAKSRGLFPRSDMSGFNWSKVPTVIVECGFLSNAAEDKLIATSAYQDKLAAGLASGVLEFVGR